MKKYSASKRKRAPTKPKRRGLYIVCVVLIIVLLLFTILELLNITNIFGNHRSNNLNSDAQTTSSVPSAQSDFSDGGDRIVGDTTGNNDIGSISDNAGTPSSNTSSPITSVTGEITLYLPIKNALVKSGQEVAGDSSLSAISYRIIDNTHGVIATGSLSVVNGKFSGNMNFDTDATEGRLDIFGTRSDGVEFSSIEVPIRFRE